MPFTLRPAEAKDIPRIAELIFAAFESDALHMAMFPREYTEQIMGWYHDRIRKTIFDPSIRTMIAVDTLGETDGQTQETIVGYSRWLVPSELSHDGDQKAKEEDSSEQIQFPPEANQSLIDFYLQRTDHIRQGYADGSQDIVLYMLATDPSYQGRGIGRMMLEWGINMAAQLSSRGSSETDTNSLQSKKTRILLEATPLAYPMYKKFCWKDYDSITIDLQQYGVVDGIKHTTVCMIKA